MPKEHRTLKVSRKHFLTSPSGGVAMLSCVPFDALFASGYWVQIRDIRDGRGEHGRRNSDSHSSIVCSPTLNFIARPNTKGRHAAIAPNCVSVSVVCRRIVVMKSLQIVFFFPLYSSSDLRLRESIATAIILIFALTLCSFISTYVMKRRIILAKKLIKNRTLKNPRGTKCTTNTSIHVLLCSVITEAVISIWS